MINKKKKDKKTKIKMTKKSKFNYYFLRKNFLGPEKMVRLMKVESIPQPSSISLMNIGKGLNTVAFIFFDLEQIFKKLSTLTSLLRVTLTPYQIAESDPYQLLLIKLRSD